MKEKTTNKKDKKTGNQNVATRKNNSFLVVCASDDKVLKAEKSFPNGSDTWPREEAVR